MDSKKLLKSLTASKGTILAPHIDAYQRRGKFPPVWSLEIRNSKPKDDFFHPSSDAFTPPRTLYLQMRGKILSQPISPALRRTFDVGHFWHLYLQAMLIEMGFVIANNVEREVQHEIETLHGKATGLGTADLVDVHIPGFGNWLVDIKTMNHNEFGQGANEYTFLKWRAQVNCYMDWLGTDKAMILAVCKDSPHDFREYQIQKDQNLLNEIYDRWTYVAECLRRNVEPQDGDYAPDPLLLNPGDSVLDAELAKLDGRISSKDVRPARS